MRKATWAIAFFLTATAAYAGHKLADYNHVGTLVSLTVTQLDHPQTYISPDGYAITCKTDGDTTDCNEGVGHPVFLVTAQIKLDDGSMVVVEHEVVPVLFAGIDTLDPLASIFDGKDGNVGNQVHYRLMEKSASKKKTEYQVDWASKDGSTKRVGVTADTSTTLLVIPDIVVARGWGKERKVTILGEQKYVINKTTVIK